MSTSPTRLGVRFGVLGPLRLPEGTEPWSALRGPKLRKLFALLLIRANQPLSVEILVEELWDGEPPRTWLATLRTHIYHLRRVLGSQETELGGALLATEAGGYVLRIPDAEIDSHVFLRKIAQGKRLFNADRVAEAADVLHDALALWRGRPLGELELGRPLRQHIAHLEEARISALEVRICADLRLGQHRELVGELRNLVSNYPLHEWFHARYMEALHRSGRRAEALQAYQFLRRMLTEELGVDPCAEVRGLHQRILAAS